MAKKKAASKAKPVTDTPDISKSEKVKPLKAKAPKAKPGEAKPAKAEPAKTKNTKLSAAKASAPAPEAESSADQPYAKIDGVIRTLYECISGPPGGQDWKRNAELFHPKALIVRTRIEDGVAVAYPFTFKTYKTATIPMLAETSFYEAETRRATQRFGQIAHVMSAYEAREAADSDAVLFRGINMIHLWHGSLTKGQPPRWWIMSIIWDNERDGVKIKKHWFD